MATDTHSKVTQSGCGFRIDFFSTRQRDVIGRTLKLVDMEIRTKSMDLERLLKFRAQLAAAGNRVGIATADDRAAQTDAMHANHMDDIAHDLDRQSFDQLNGGRS